MINKPMTKAQMFDWIEKRLVGLNISDNNNELIMCYMDETGELETVKTKWEAGKSLKECVNKAIEKSFK